MELKFRLVSSKGSKGGNADEAAKVNYSDKNRKSVERAAAAASFAPEKSTLLCPKAAAPLSVPLSREFVYIGERKNLRSNRSLLFLSDGERDRTDCCCGGRWLARVVRGIGHALVIANFHPLETELLSQGNRRPLFRPNISRSNQPGRIQFLPVIIRPKIFSKFEVWSENPTIRGDNFYS